jgi:hypothetical protein
MIDLAQIAEICAKHGMLEQAGNGGFSYWVHPEFADTLMIDIGENRNWQDKTPGQQVQAEKDLGMSFDNSSLADLDNYLTNLVTMLRRIKADA